MTEQELKKVLEKLDKEYEKDKEYLMKINDWLGFVLLEKKYNSECKMAKYKRFTDGRINE